LRAVIFDRDGVLVQLDEARLARDLPSYLPLSRAELADRWQAFRGARALDAMDERAEISRFLDTLADAMALDASARTRLATLDYAAYLVAHPDAAGALRLARCAGCLVGVLTNNTAHLSARRMLELTGLAPFVDITVSAQELGAAKPAPAAYRGVAAKLGALPQDCLFFDNTRAWVDGARAVGMDGYLVDRAAAAHDLARGVVRDLTALEAILSAGRDTRRA
jgi:HAD superfamily hydrolase (TIGR01509 family)